MNFDAISLTVSVIFYKDKISFVTISPSTTGQPPRNRSRQCLEYQQYRGTGHIPVYEGTYQAGSFKPRTSASISGVIVQVPAANLSAFTF